MSLLESTTIVSTCTQKTTDTTPVINNNWMQVSVLVSLFWKVSTSEEKNKPKSPALFFFHHKFYTEICLECCCLEKWSKSHFENCSRSQLDTCEKLCQRGTDYAYFVVTICFWRPNRNWLFLFASVHVWVDGYHKLMLPAFLGKVPNIIPIGTDTSQSYASCWTKHSRFVIIQGETTTRLNSQNPEKKGCFMHPHPSHLIPNAARKVTSNSNSFFPLTLVLFLSLDFKIGRLGDFIPTWVV